MKKILVILLIVQVFFANSQSVVNPPTFGLTGGPTNGETGIVGNIKGAYSTSPSGAMIYSIPIIAPTGAGGMKPNLSIVYNSQGGNGSMGIGWSISGISAITRSGKTIFNDGKADGVHFTSDDFFNLDGNRLEAVSGQYGVNGTQYTTEVESYAKIISYTSSTTPNEPDYFIVKTKDGMTYEYGNSTTSRVEASTGLTNPPVKMWLLNRVTNADGFEMEYLYKEYPNGEVLLWTINYSQNSTLSSSKYLFSIVIDYTTNAKDDKYIDKYLEGAQTANNSLLKSIHIKHNDDDKYLYTFTYSNSSTGAQYTHLEKIQLEASTFEKDTYGHWNAKRDGNGIIFEKYNPLEIDWSDEGLASFGTSINNNSNFTIADGYEDITSSTRLIGDFNGDGKDDVLGAIGKNIDVALSNGNGFDSKHTWINNFDIFNQISVNQFQDWDVLGNSPYCGTYNLLMNPIAVGDINGDGLADVVGFNELTTVVLISDGSKFNLTQNFKFFSSGGETPHRHWNPINSRFLCDVNGDGRADIVGYGKEGVYVSLSLGNTFAQPQLWTTAFSDNSGWADNDFLRTIADVNGDGMADLVGFGDQSVYVRLSNGQNGFDGVSSFNINAYTRSQGWANKDDAGYYTYKRQMADVNGDGLSDIVGFGWDNVYVSLSTGVSFQSATAWSANMGYADGGYGKYYHNGDIIFGGEKEGDYPICSRMLADVNGDGKADLLGFNETFVHVELSTGKNFSNSNNYWHTGYCYNAEWHDAIVHPRMFGDFNGDGSMDIIGFGQSTYSCAFSNNTMSKVSKIIDSFDNEEEFTYLPITSSDCYTKGSGATYPIMDFQKPLYVLHKYYNPNERKFTRFDYSGAKVHLQGKGFLGFAKIEVSKNSNGVYMPRSVTKNTIEPAYYFMYPSEIEQYNTIGLISKTNNILTVNNLTPTGFTFKKYRAYPSKSFTKEYYYETSQSTNTFKRSILKTSVIDAYGNPTQSNTYISASQKVITDAASTYEYASNTSNTYNNVNNSNYYIFGLPLTTETINTTPGNTDDISKTQIIYSTAIPYRITSITTTPNNNSAYAKTVYFNSYDIYGNVLSKTEAGVTEKYEYNLSAPYYGRFLTKKTVDPSGYNFISTYEYNPISETMVSQTDLNGFTTSYEYNSFGSLQKTIHPDGTETHSVLRWARYADPPLEDEPEGALFYSWTASSGNSPEVTFFNSSSQNIRNVSIGFGGKKIYSDQSYYGLLKTYDSDPYFKNETPSNFRQYYYNYSDEVLLEYNDYYIQVQIERNANVITEKYFDVNDPFNYPNNPYKSFTKTNNVIDQLITSTDPGGSISYSYFSNGQIKETSYNGSSTTFSYDDANNRIGMSDPNAGNLSYTYNQYGQMIEQIDARGINTEYYYDILGRLVKKYCHNVQEEVRYTYDNADNTASSNPPTTFGLLASVDLINGSSGFVYNKTFRYDLYDRTEDVIESFDGQNFKSSSKYNSNGQQSKFIYPSGLELNYNYNSNGFLTSIGNDQTEYWNRKSTNEYGQTTTYLLNGGNIPVNKTYTSQGIINTIKTGDAGKLIQDLEYDFNTLTGNMNSRIDNIHDMGEVFTYDNQNRLLSSTVTDKSLNPIANPVSTIYANDGNISQKSDVGDYNYNGTKPNAVTLIDNPVSLPSEELQLTKFNHFNKIDNIRHDAEEKEIQYYYNSAQQRVKTVFSDMKAGIEKTKYFVGGNYEFEDNNGDIRGLNYIFSPDGLVCIVEDDGVSTPKSTNFVLTDHLGSIYAFVDPAGGIINYKGDEQVFSFDPWGNRRDFQNWSAPVATTNFLFDRGFTGHQMLDEFGIIDMNGRIYDPVIARFFSPDPFIQAPTNTQNFNRYSYCLNNPLVYSDPSGEFIILAAILVGAAIGAYQGYMIGAAHGATGWGMAGYMLGGAAIGGVAGVASAGVGIAVGGAVAGAGLGGFAAGAITGAAAGATGGAINGFGMTALGGGTLGQAFAAAGTGALIGAATGAALGGTIQGISAARNGNNFWTGKPNSPLPSIERQTLEIANREVKLNTENMRAQFKELVPDEGAVQYKTEYFSKVSGSDGQHVWNRHTVEIVVDNGKVFTITGGDDSQYLLIQQVGKHHGTTGVFEMVLDKGAYVISHQRFIPGGTVTGVPNVVTGTSGSVSPAFPWWQSLYGF